MSDSLLKNSKWQTIAAIGATLAVFFYRAWDHIDTVVDDAWISARYAQHLAQGFGPTYNSAEAPVEGFTNMGFVILTAITHLFGANPHSAMTGLGLVFSGIGLVAITLVTRSITQKSTPLNAAPALFWALDPHYAIVASNGLESSMYFAWVMVTLLVALELPKRGRTLLAFLLGALFWIRPEGVAIAVIIALFDSTRLAFQKGQEGVFKKRDTWTPWIGIFMGVASLTLFRLMYFGALLPNTFAAKGHRPLQEQLKFNLRYFGSDAQFWIATTVIGAIGLALLFRHKGAWLLAACFLFVYGIAFQVDLWMPGGRLVLLAAAFGTMLYCAAAILQKQIIQIPMLVLFAYGLTHLVDGPIPKHVFRYDKKHSALPANQAELAAKHLARYAPKGAVLATRDAGVLAYHVGTGVTVLELHHRSLTRLHKDGADMKVTEYVPENPEIFIGTSQRINRKRHRYPGDVQVFKRLTEPYRYYGRVYQHYHRYYDIYVRGDIDIPPLPSSYVTNNNMAPDTTNALPRY